MLNVIIDEDGKIIKSERDSSLDSIDKKHLGIYTEIITIYEKNVELQDIKNELEINSYYEKGKFLLHNFIFMVEQLKCDLSLTSLLPSLIDLSFILPYSNKEDKEILKCFLEDKSQPYEKCFLIQ